MDEVSRQVQPIITRLDSAERWARQLWSNGSGGPPGYLELAREEDNRRYRRLFEEIGELKAESLREEGKETLRREMEIAKVKLEELAAVKTTHKWSRAHSAMAMALSLGGAFISYVLHPALHAFALWLAGTGK